MSDVSIAEADVPPTQQIRRISASLGRVITWVVYVYVLIVEVILALGFLLLLLGADPSSGFVEWAYRSLDRAMRPFRGIFASIDLGVTGNDVASVFDTSVLFAMIVYGIIAIALSSLLHWLSSRVDRIDTENRFRAVELQHRRAEQQHQAAELAYRRALLESQQRTAPPDPADAPPA